MTVLTVPNRATRRAAQRVARTDRTVQVNRAYAQLFDAAQRYLVAWGGRRSGKSVGYSQMYTDRLTRQRRALLCIRKIARTLRFSVWRRMLSAIDEAIGLEFCDVNKSELSITLPNGSLVLCAGCDDPEKLKSIEGFTDVWIEEATELEESDFDTLDAGLSADVDPPPSMGCTFNPIPMSADQGAEVHWLARRFQLSEQPYDSMRVEGDVLKLRTWFESNRFCPEANRKLLLSYRKTNPDLWNMWGLGKFITLIGAILKNWDVVDGHPDRPPDAYGLDFGFADDPVALLALWESVTDGDTLHQVLYATDLTNQALSLEMEAEGVHKHVPIYADNAEPKSIRELQVLGWNVLPSLKGPDYKRVAAKYINERKTHFTASSVDLRREAAAWSWRRNRQSGKIMPIPEDGNDHTTDAWIYAKYRKKIMLLSKRDPLRDDRAGKPATAGVRDKRW